MELRKSETMKNLAAAYAGECQATVRYRFLAYAARQQKLFKVAEAVDEIVKNEFHHARMFYTAIQSADKRTIEGLDVVGNYPFKEKWDLLKNFDFAVENELSEHRRIYPAFEAKAKEEGFDGVALLFRQISAVENCHSKRLSAIGSLLKSGTLYKRDKPVKWKCGQCGHEEKLLEAWETCPVCGSERGYVELELK